MYEAVIKVRVEDPPEKRASDIAEGIDCACSLLMDEYGQSATEIEDMLERCVDAAHDHEAMADV